MSADDLGLSRDDRLDALALIRAHRNRDAQAVHTLIRTSGHGMYLALLDLTAALVHKVSRGQPEEYLDAIINQLHRGERNDD